MKRYEFTFSEDRLEYYFYSVGPRGIIRKVVRFQHVDKAEPVYNLGFGDLDQETGLLIDFAKSNNGDRDMVMATVAATIWSLFDPIQKVLYMQKGLTKYEPDCTRWLLHRTILRSH